MGTMMNWRVVELLSSSTWCLQTGRQVMGVALTCSRRLVEEILPRFLVGFSLDSTLLLSLRSLQCHSTKCLKCYLMIRLASHWEGGFMERVFHAHSECPLKKNPVWLIRKYPRKSSSPGSTRCTWM